MFSIYVNDKTPDADRPVVVECDWIASGDTLVGGSLSASVESGDVTLGTPAVVDGKSDQFEVTISGGTVGTFQRVQVVCTTAANHKETVFIELRVRE